MSKKITFIGGGSFGTALGIALAKKGHSIKIWDRKERVINNINIAKENIDYLPNVSLPSNIFATRNMMEAVSGADYIVLSVPSHAVRSVSKELSQYVNETQIIVSLAKGIEENTYKRMSVVIGEEISSCPVVIFSGPSHAEEIAVDIPTTAVVSSMDKKAQSMVQDDFMTNKLRLYTNDDLIGIEIGGAVKNIIALAAGISDGIGYGDNTKAALMTRGMSEIIKIGQKLGGKTETFYGLTGMGDLIVTCTSMHSRNRRAGILIGQGHTVNQAAEEVGMVVEGIKACKAFYELKEKIGVEMPITDILYKVLFEAKDPRYGVFELMSRDKKSESY